MKQESRPYLVEGRASEGPREAALRKAAVAETVIHSMAYTSAGLNRKK